MRVAASEQELYDTLATGFDVTTQWPLRARLLQMADGEYIFAVVAHHIGVDGESMLPLVTDIVTAYAARAQGNPPAWTPLPVQFADYAIWQHQALGSAGDTGSVTGRQLAYWRERLAGVPDVIELPADRPRPAVATHRGAQAGFEIPAAVADQVTAIAAAHGMTPFMVAHAALAALMARLSAGDDITIATPIAGRGQTVLDPMVGMFVNTLVLRTGIQPGDTFADLLGRVRDTDLAAFAHADVPFETVVEALDPVRSEAFSPLAQVILSEHGGTFPEDHATILELPGVGPYTAGAVASFAFGQAQPIVDGNVARVLSRIFNDPTPIDSPQGRDVLWKRATELVQATDDPRALNSALMELGQTHCRTGRPDCEACPVRTQCRATEPESLPAVPPSALLAAWQASLWPMMPPFKNSSMCSSS